jgi:hypothetical protein
MTKPPRPFPRRQQGVAALFMTFILLLVAGLVLLYTSRGAVMEQRLSANEIRTKQAFAAANSGIDHALAYMVNGGIDHGGDGTPDTLNSLTLTQSGGTGTPQPVYYRAVYCLPGAAVTCPAAHTTAPTCTAPTDFAEVMVASCGWSDDDSAVHLVTQRIGGTPSLPGAVPNPLISRGTANLLVGGASVLNYFNDLTVWSGGSMLGQSMTGKTFVRDTVAYPTGDKTTDSDNDGTPNYRDTGNSPSCNNSPTGYVCATQGSTFGHDTVTGDTRLTQGTDDDFFELFFGESPADYRDKTASWVVDTNNSLSTENSTYINSIVGMGDQAIWVTGDVSLPGNVGSKDHPVILIIDGDLALVSNAEINGVVFVRGDVTGNGTPTIYGAMIVAGDANITGNPNIIYDPYGGTSLLHNGKATKLQGSWKDW